jgi:hypothetical protein
MLSEVKESRGRRDGGRDGPFPDQANHAAKECCAGSFDIARRLRMTD